MTGTTTLEPSAPTDAPPADRRARGGWVKPTVITVLGVVGLLVAVLALLPVVGWGVVRLASGSMAPEYPTNALLLVRQIPGSDAHVGDVVMVQRAGQLPVTHRVVAARATGGDGAVLELKGDANPDPDPVAYTVQHVDLVVTGLPAGGQVLGLARTPLALGVITVIATGVVLWAWWPRRRDAEG
jgi:signal peptidase I